MSSRAMERHACIYPEKYKFEQQISGSGHPPAIAGKTKRKIPKNKGKERQKALSGGEQEPDIQMLELRAADMQPKIKRIKE